MRWFGSLGRGFLGGIWMPGLALGRLCTTDSGTGLGVAGGAICFAQARSRRMWRPSSMPPWFGLTRMRLEVEAYLRAVIPPGRHRKRKRRIVQELYRLRYRVEVFFHRLKRYRRIATRYDKTAVCFLAFLHVACTMLSV